MSPRLPRATRRDRLRYAILRLTGIHAGRQRSYDLVPRDFHSPIPDAASLPPESWDRERPVHGLGLDPDVQIGFAESELAAGIEEFETRPKPPGFALANPYYSSVDAEITYAMFEAPTAPPGDRARFRLLHDGPVARLRGQCRGRVALLSHRDRPFPQRRARPIRASALTELRQLPVQEVPLGVFEELQAGDVLFVDTSHTVKVGGDVPFIVLEVLPVLGPGVHVHFHDIFLPGDYPRIVIEDMEMSWSDALPRGIPGLQRGV